MGDAYLTAIAALAGSAIGALASLGTTWLNQHAQERARRLAELRGRRAQLYEEFMDEASKLYVDSLTHDLGDDVSKFVHLYALVGKIRLVSSTEVIGKADDVMRRIIESYESPSFRDFKNITKEWDKNDLDVLRHFSEACREDLSL
jgi:hypothetical protein